MTFALIMTDFGQLAMPTAMPVCKTMMNCVFKTRDCVLNMMAFAGALPSRVKFVRIRRRPGGTILLREVSTPLNMYT